MWLHEEVGLRKSEVTTVLRKYASVGKLLLARCGRRLPRLPRLHTQPVRRPCWRLRVARQALPGAGVPGRWAQLHSSPPLLVSVRLLAPR